MNERGHYGHYGHPRIGADPFTAAKDFLTSTASAIASAPAKKAADKEAAEKAAVEKAKKSALAHLEGYRYGSRVRAPGKLAFWGEAHLDGGRIPLQKESADPAEMEHWLLSNSGADCIWAGYFDVKNGRLIREAIRSKIIGTRPALEPSPPIPPSLPASMLPTSPPPLPPEEAKSSTGLYVAIGALAVLGVGGALYLASRSSKAHAY
jgi:hypothetical protein